MHHNIKRKHSLHFKDFIRVRIFPVIATVLKSLGADWKFLGEKMGSIVLIPQIKSMTRHVSVNDFPANGKEVVIVTMLGGHVFNASIDIALAWSLMARGYKVRVIIDDCFLPINENHRAGRESQYEYISYLDHLIGSAYFNAAKIDSVKLSDSVKSEAWEKEDIREFEYMVEASLFKHYKVGILTPDLPLLEQKRKMFEDSVKITSALGRVLVKQKPDLVIMSHGIYSTWGPQFVHLRNANIPVVTYGRGKKAHTEKFNWNFTGDWWDVSREWEKVKQKELTAPQRAKIDSYLAARVNHKDDALVYNFGGLEAKEVLMKKYNLDPAKVTFSLFTNVLWDAASAQREIAFANPIQWVIETIQWFADHPDKQLVVKIHPAEVVIGTNQPFEKILLQNIDRIPDNVRIIKPQEIINSWSVYDITDMGIVHTTTAGMEIPLGGKPCIVVSKTHFREKGFTEDVNSKEEYFKLLKDFSPSKMKTEERERLKDLSYKYAYLLFERFQLPFRIFNEYGSLNIKSFKHNTIEELIDDKDLSYVIDCLEKEEDFLLPE